MFFILQSLLITFIEMMCCKIFFDLFCDIDNRRKNIGVMLPFILSGFVFVISYLLAEHLFIKEILITFLVTVLMMKLHNEYSFIRNLILSVIFISLVFVTEYLSIVIFSGFRERTDEQSIFLDAMLVMFSKAALFILIIFINQFIDKKSLKYFEDTQWIQLLFFPVFSICMIVAIITKTGDIIDNRLDNVFWMLAFGLVSMNIIVFYSIKDMAWKSKQIHESEMFQMQTCNQLELYERIIADTEHQRKISHEYKNQIECIQTLCETGDYAELKNYLESINGVIRHDLDRINTNHAIVNAVLNAKYEEAVDKGILFVCRINDMSGIQMERQDIVVLLANILNNAIEACEKCNGDKYIKFKMVHEGDNLILSEKNSYDGVMCYENGKIVTTKTDNRHEHGLGIKNIKQVIEKYGGYYSIQSGENEFYISIMIPQEKSTQ